ncbi:MAG: DNA topoisomerase VI subunit B, partial [Methanomassiliicoccaceae archaeon]|nr:DNA topoisomerase VI subunit B [Methanomassiliicoccaceae archaeon]
DTKINRPIVTNDTAFTWEGKEHGTKIEYTTKGRYITGKQSIFEYLKNTAIVNPHARIEFHDPEGKKYLFERATEQMPPKSKEVKPHPEGMEIGDLMKYSQNTQQKTVSAFLKSDFSRITDRIAEEILTKAKVDPSLKPSDLSRDQCKAIIAAIATVKIMAPPTDCLSPIGDVLIKKGLMHILGGMRPDYYATPVTRPPKAVNGNPFVVEAGIVYGGEIPSDEPVMILRFANRVPLLYQQGACVITKAISEVDWRRYGLEQRGGKGIPFGPAIILVHVASTKVPFTSEGKEAVASFAELQNEIEQALRLCARNLKSHLNKMERRSKASVKFEIVQKLIPAMAKKSSEMLGRPVPDLSRTISKIMNVVWVESGAKKEGQKTLVVKYTLYNYTMQERSIALHTKVPKECVNLTLFTNPYYINNMTDDGKVMWEVKNLPPSKSITISFELKGEMADTFDADDVFVSGINPALVMGAEALPGDWGIKGMEIIETDEIIPADEEDEAEEAEDLGDE